MDTQLKIIKLLASRNSIKRAKAVDELAALLSRGCWLTLLALEYALCHDPNYRVKYKILALLGKH